MEGGLMKTILKIVLNFAQMLASYPYGRWLVKTILEILALWLMQAICVEGGLVKTNVAIDA